MNIHLRLLSLSLCSVLLAPLVSAQTLETIEVSATTPNPEATTIKLSSASYGIYLTLENASPDNSEVFFKSAGNSMISYAGIFIGENVNATFATNNFCPRAARDIPYKFEVAEGATATFGTDINSRGGISVGYDNPATTSIKGNLIVNGKMAAGGGGFGGDSYLAKFYGDVTFYANSSFSQNGVQGNATDGTKITTNISRPINLLTGKMTVYAGEGKIKFDDYLFLRNGTLNLKSSNAIISGAGVKGNIVVDGQTQAIAQATSQADSTFFICTAVSGSPTAPAGTTVGINSFVQNNIGALNIYTGSTVTLDTSVDDTENNLVGKGVLQIKELIMTDGNKLTLNLRIDADRKSLQIENFEEFYAANKDGLTINIYDASSSIEEKNVSFDSTTGLLGSNFMVNNGWITAVVPEPAEWAIIFGAVALAFVAYRRRKA